MNSKKITRIILLVALFVMVSITPVYASSFDVAFDAKYYLENNGDLKAAYGNDYNAAYNHFIHYGIKEGRATSSQFDVRYYLANNGDLKAAYGDNYVAAFNHFINWGIKEGRVTSPEFDVRHYLANNGDLLAAYGDNYVAAYNHYAYWGKNEGRVVDGNSHVYGEVKVTKPATCTEAGEQVSFCKVCGTAKKEEIPAPGHTYGEAEVTKPETCTEDGEKTLTCTVCGDVKTEAIPAAHSFTKKIQTESMKATCTEDGSYYMVCDREGCEAVEQELDENEELVNKIYVEGKLGHSFTEKRVLLDPTCTKDGSYVMACDRDGCPEVEKELNEEGILVEQVYTEPTQGHTFVKDAEGNDKVWTKAATCEKDGYELKVCSVCGETVSTVLPKSGHNYGTPVFTWDELTATAKVICVNNDKTIPVDVNVTSETTQATCEEDGKTVYTATATYNGETYTDTKTVAIPASGHDWNAGVTTALPNGDDLTTYTCNKCEATRTETTHKHLVTYKTLKEATCGEEGLEAQICLNCNKTVKTPTPTLAHTLTKTDTKAATCTEAGNIDYWTCSKCNKIFSDEGTTEITAQDTVIEKVAHTLTKTDAKAATCTTPGNIEYWTCSECDKIFSDEAGTKETTAEAVKIPAAHDEELKHEARVEATCTTPGNIEYWTCESCGTKFSDEAGTKVVEDVVIPATGHTLVKTAAKDATCTEEGNTDYWTCSKCNKIYSDEAGATETTAEAVKIAATGHSLTKTNAKEATCTTPGNIDYWTCSKCNKIYSDAEGSKETTAEAVTIPAAHDEELKHEARIEATCTTPGNIEYWTCESCGTKFSDEAGTKVVEDVVIPAGHAWSVVGTKADCEYATLTCLNKGCEYYGKEVSAETLIKAGKITQEVATAAGYVPTEEHDIDTIIIVEPTAEKDGLATDRCNICHKDIRVKYTLKYVAPVAP